VEIDASFCLNNIFLIMVQPFVLVSFLSLLVVDVVVVFFNDSFFLKKNSRVGQVGIRCQHCADLPLRQRGRGAVYYPTKLAGVYQAAQNMAVNHLNDFCHRLNAEIRNRLLELRNSKETASGGSKKYWAEACAAVGLYEDEDGLRFHVASAATPPL
jgi:hypothetical protein